MNFLRYKSVIALAVLCFVASGCTNLEYVKKAAGVPNRLDDILTKRRAEADAQQRQVEVVRTRLTASKKAVADAQIKLEAAKKKTGPAAELARKISAEMDLKRRDLESKNRDLIELESQITRYRNDQSSKSETVGQVEQIKAELRTTQAEIAQIENYLKTDLLIRAENAAKFD